ncbi:MAG: hypothetical protein AABY74_10035 [Planctomycetota bacterium]
MAYPLFFELISGQDLLTFHSISLRHKPVGFNLSPLREEIKVIAW